MIGILILCTGNSARSILGEALFNALGQGQIKAWSAGSQPAGVPNPLALELLQAKGHDTTGLRSKSWDEFSTDQAPVLDGVITVCDNAASEVCPIWPGAPVSVHWGLPDPAGVSPEAAARAAFAETYDRLHAAITKVMAAPDLVSAAGLKAALEGAKP